MGSDWSAPDVLEWKEEAFKTQQEYHISLSDRTWDCFYESQLKYLRAKICFALFGSPEEYEDTDEELPGYTEEQKKKAAEICEKLVELSFRHIENEGVLMAIVFVCIKMHEKNFTLPVFRVCIDTDRDEDEASYIDSTGRVYKDWKDYLDNNTLPKCMYCYPTNGFYTDRESGDDDEFGKVDISYGTSPACDLSNRIKTVLDFTGMAGSSFSAGILVASFFTPVGPILATTSAAVGAGSAVYGTYRSAEVLVDRGKHDQSTSLLDPEARAAWISLVGSLLGIAAGGATKAMVASARSGNVLNMAGRIAVTAANFGSLTVNGIGLANGLAHLIDKMTHNELKPLDLYQFTLGILFFTNGVMNMKTASTIIKETQNQVLAEFKARLSSDNDRVVFDRIAADTRGNRQMHGNGRVIKNLHKIENLQQFMTSLVQSTYGEQDKVKFDREGKIRINDQLSIHADAFAEMTADNQAAAMQATRKFAANQNTAEYLKAIKNVCRTERIKFELQREMAENKIVEVLEVEHLTKIKIGGKEIFKDLRPFEKDRLYDVMIASESQIDPRLAKIALKLAESQNCTQSAEYCAMIEFVTKHVSKLKDDATLKPNQSWTQWKTELLEGMLNPNSAEFRSMNAKFNQLEVTLSQINDSSQFQFKCQKSLTYHIYKHDNFQHGLVNEREYFSILNELFGAEVNMTQVRLTQEGTNVRMVYEDPAKGLFGVLIKPRHLSGSSGVFVATMYYNQRLVRR